jgi:hypothetical protein
MHKDPDGDCLTAARFFASTAVGHFESQTAGSEFGMLPLKNITEYDRMKSALEKISVLVDAYYRDGRHLNHREVKEITLDGLFGETRGRE